MAPVIDADAHVDETEATWSYMSEAEVQYRPTTVYPQIHPIHAREGNGRFWQFSNGNLQQRRLREDPTTGEIMLSTGDTTVATRELIDVGARLRHMDELGIDRQVLYPTLFIDAVTENPAEERAVTNSYNRWLAERTAESGGRLRWVVVPSLLDMENAVQQLRFGKEHGACGVILRGEGSVDGRGVVDPMFYPLYAEAGRLDLPVCFHTGKGMVDYSLVEKFSRDPAPLAFANSFIRSALPPVNAFLELVLHRIPSKFPDLRFGFIEANSSWVPFLMYDLKRRQTKLAKRPGMPQFDSLEGLLDRNRLYVTCLVDEDLATNTKAAGEGNIMVGTDYSHPDVSFDLQIVPILRERGTRGDATLGDVPAPVIEKILYDNPHAFYHI